MRVLLAAVLLVGACTPDPGECDLSTVGEIVYDLDGNPAFAGQAVILQSCGGGGLCHTDTLAGVDLDNEMAVMEAHANRRGAPAGLTFDLNLASTNADENPEEQARLGEDQQRVANMAGEILEQIQSGAMPPGALGADVGGRATYDRVMDDGVTFVALPRLARAASEAEDALAPGEVEEATAIVRNWLACGAPVIERTVDVRVIEPVGFVVAGCERECVDVRWTDADTSPGRPPTIFDDIITATCAFAACHDAADSAAQLDWETGGAMGVLTGIVNVEAVGRQCGVGSPPPSIVVPMDPDASLMVIKLEATSSDMVCGSPMPLVGNHLSDQRLCAIREWIACGACADEPDGAAAAGSCARCLSDARVTCNVDVSQTNFCASSAPCANSFDL